MQRCIHVSCMLVQFTGSRVHLLFAACTSAVVLKPAGQERCLHMNCMLTQSTRPKGSQPLCSIHKCHLRCGLQTQVRSCCLSMGKCAALLQCCHDVMTALLLSGLSLTSERPYSEALMELQCRNHTSQRLNHCNKNVCMSSLHTSSGHYTASSAMQTKLFVCCKAGAHLGNGAADLMPLRLICCLLRKAH